MRLYPWPWCSLACTFPWQPGLTQPFCKRGYKICLKDVLRLKQSTITEHLQKMRVTKMENSTISGNIKKQQQQKRISGDIKETQKPQKTCISWWRLSWPLEKAIVMDHPTCFVPSGLACMAALFCFRRQSPCQLLQREARTRAPFLPGWCPGSGWVNLGNTGEMVCLLIKWLTRWPLSAFLHVRQCSVEQRCSRRVAATVRCNGLLTGPE